MSVVVTLCSFKNNDSIDSTVIYSILEDVYRLFNIVANVKEYIELESKRVTNARGAITNIYDLILWESKRPHENLWDLGNIDYPR